MVGALSCANDIALALRVLKPTAFEKKPVHHDFLPHVKDCWTCFVQGMNKTEIVRSVHWRSKKRVLVAIQVTKRNAPAVTASINKEPKL